MNKKLLAVLSLVASLSMLAACGSNTGDSTSKCTHENMVAKSDETNHWLECECGETFEVEAHEAGTEVKYNETHHWNECECGYEMNVEAHTLEGDSNETHHWGECACGYVEEETAHTYNIAKSDETHHWNECACGASEEKVAHDYNVAKSDETHHWDECVCGASEEKVAHDYVTEKHDESNHWNECECGEKINVVEHDYNIAKSDETHHWNECACGASEEKVEHDYVLDDTDATVDTLACECGYVNESYSFNKVVTATNTFNINDETIALDLTGISGYSSVALIVLGEYTLGTDINALEIPDELKADKANHGEQEITVFVVDADGYEHLISVPVTIITKNIVTAEDFKAVQMTSATDVIYGYYVLQGNITSTSAIAVSDSNYRPKAVPENNASVGFRGTLDGNGYTITTPAGVGGLFGGLGDGAVIKNMTVTCTSLTQRAWQTLLASVAVGTRIENCVFNYDNLTTAEAERHDYGIMFEISSLGCEFVSVEINITGQVNNLFGKHTNNYDGFNGNDRNRSWNASTFKDCTINLRGLDSTLEMLGSSYDGSTSVTYQPTGVELADGEATVDGIKLTSERPDVKLAAQYLLTTSETVSLDLGDYAGYTVQSISLDGKDIGTTDVSAITIPAEIKADPSKHGTGSTYTVVVDKDGAPYKIAIPVIMVTRAIATETDFAAVQLTSKNGTVYGYYILTADIGKTTAIASVSNNYHTAVAQGTAGFMGTLDGRGHTITYAIPTSASGCLFGAIGNGAYIKDVTFDVPSAKPGYHMALLGASVVGATFENVKFDFKNTEVGGYALLAGYSVAKCTFTNVEFYIDGAAGSLFASGSSSNGFDGLNPVNVGDCKFTDCKIWLAAGASIKQLGKTYNGVVYVVDGCSSTGTTVEGITIVKATE